MKFIISRVRFVALLMAMVWIVVCSYLIYPIIPLASWRKYFHRSWTYVALWAVGARMEIKGTIGKDYIQPNTMFVQNHVSWLDTIVMSRLYCTNYVGKVEMLKWKLLKNIIISGGTVFIDRKNKRELVMANKKIAAVLQDGWAMGLFPEGTTSDGSSVLPFHASIFEAAILAKSRIVPVVVRYRNLSGGLCKEVTFSKKRWMESVWNTLHLNGFVIKVDILEPVYAADFENREAISNYMYEKISQVYHSDL